MRRDRRGQGGQVVPLVAVLLVVAGALALGVVHVGAAAARAAAAQAAADATALAGAAEGRPAAERVAVANGATIASYRTEGSDVVVTVDRSGRRASARARWDPGRPPAAPRWRAISDGRAARVIP